VQRFQQINHYSAHNKRLNLYDASKAQQDVGSLLLEAWSEILLRRWLKERWGKIRLQDFSCVKTPT
jgi:hypothetical protein